MPKFHVELNDGRKFEVESDSKPSESEIMKAIGQDQFSFTPDESAPIAQKGEPIKEGIAAGFSRSAVRGLMKGGLGMLQTAENAQQMITGQPSKFQNLIDQSQQNIESTMPQGDVSGSIPGRVVENFAQIPGLGTQIEGLGGGLGGFAAQGALQEPQSPLQGGGKGLLQGMVFNAIASMPLLPRISLGATAFGIPSVLTHQDAEQQAADAITGGLLMGVAPGAIENTKPGEPSPIRRGREIIVDALKQSDTLRPLVDAAGKYGLDNMSKAISATTGTVSEHQAKLALEKPEYLSKKYVQAEKIAAENLMRSEVTPLVKDTNNRVVIGESTKQDLLNMNLFVESNEKITNQGLDRFFSQIIAQTGGEFSPEFREKLGMTKQEINAAKKRISRLEETSVLTSMKDSEKAKILGWYDSILNTQSMSFNKVRSMIAEMDHNSAMQARYKELAKMNQPLPSTQFVRIGSEMRNLLSKELKSQYEKAGDAIDRFANYKKAEGVNRAFNNWLGPNTYKAFIARALFSVVGLPFKGPLEAAYFGATSPKAVGATISGLNLLGNLSEKSLNPNIKFRR